MTSRRLALFATGPVGVAIAQLLAETRTPIALVAVDDDDPRRADIDRATADIRDDEVVAASAIHADGGERIVRDRDVDLGVLAWWPRILRRPLIEAAREGFLNFHPGLLPHCRGKDPNYWALRDGLPFGVTIHFVDEGVDTGPIAFQREIETTWEDNGERLYERGQAALLDLFRESLPAIVSGEIPAVPQDDSLATTHRRSELSPASEIVLDESYTARDLLNRIRARTFEGHPGTWFVGEDGERYEVRIKIDRRSPER